VSIAAVDIARPFSTGTLCNVTTPRAIRKDRAPAACITGDAIEALASEVQAGIVKSRIITAQGLAGRVRNDSPTFPLRKTPAVAGSSGRRAGHPQHCRQYSHHAGALGQILRLLHDGPST
jgi:hypothetical protein